VDDLLSSVFTDQYRIIGFVTLILLATSELGYRWGRLARNKLEQGQQAQVGAIEGATLGLLALLLGFTFAMAVQRFETRRSLIVQESNAIGTTLLRSSFLPVDQRGEVRELLLSYIDSRLEYSSASLGSQRMTDALAKSAALQTQLWSHAETAARQAPNPVTVSFVTSLNEMIDVDALRLAALRNRVPEAVWLLVLLVAACGTGVCGYGCGITGRRIMISQVALPVLIAIVITILSDLDNSRRGLIRNSHQSLIDLKKSMGSAPASEGRSSK